MSPSRVVVRATKPMVTATVKTAGGAPVGGGTVNVYEDGRNLGTAAVANGTATVKLKAFTTTGSHDLSVEYTGVAGTTKDSSTTVRRHGGQGQAGGHGVGRAQGRPPP